MKRSSQLSGTDLMCLCEPGKIHKETRAERNLSKYQGLQRNICGFRMEENFKTFIWNNDEFGKVASHTSNQFVAHFKCGNVPRCFWRESGRLDCLLTDKRQLTIRLREETLFKTTVLFLESVFQLHVPGQSKDDPVLGERWQHDDGEGYQIPSGRYLPNIHPKHHRSLGKMDSHKKLYFVRLPLRVF